MLSPEHLLAEIQQQTADLAATLRLYLQHYGQLPAEALPATLLTTLLQALPSSPPSTPLDPSPSSYPFCAYGTRVWQTVHARGQYALARHYRYALASFMHYLDGQDLPLSALTPSVIKGYEVWLLHTRGTCRNTSSFYLRQLRAIYHRAVHEGLVADLHPFRDVYTGVDRTRHRALSATDVHRIQQLDLRAHPAQAQARDLFLFSYYTRGMSFVDMAYLRQSSLTSGQLTYTRRKTRQTITIRWEPEMQQVLSRLDLHRPPSSSVPSPFLLPILTSPPSDADSLYRQYLTASRHCNQLLLQIGRQLRLPIPLTMYVARHSWASGAYRNHIPVSVISHALGHQQGSERVTSIYLATLDSSEVDRANRQLIHSVTHPCKNAYSM